MRAQANGIELEYDTFGNPNDPVLVLIMGLAMQMVAWDPDFCGMLAERGFHVVRFDNRDVGLSTKVRGGPKPNVLQAMVGRTPRAGYTLVDMADDTVGLLDHLGVPAGHVVGASMGGMIGQIVAIRHPERVLSLCSLMSSMGDRRTARPRLRALGVLLRKAPSERDAYIEYSLRVAKTIGSPDYPLDEERIRRRAAESYDRCHYPAGIARQLLAILASGNRRAELGRVRAPAVVIHGTRDLLAPPRAGRATARAIPGARLVEIEGMGHDLPKATWPQIVDAIVENARRARQPEGVTA
jgi:pimeloyl-ACP methyl ester carboxylesterase